MITVMLCCGAKDTSAKEKERLKVVYGGDTNYAPYEYLNEKGQPEGFNIDMIKAIADHMGFDIEFRFDNWATTEHGFNNKKGLDIVCMFHTKERTKSIGFCPPHFVVSHELIIRNEDNHIQDIQQLEGKEVLYEGGSVLGNRLLEEIPGIKIIPASSEIDAMKTLASGRYDAAIISQYQANMYIDAQKEKILGATGSMSFPFEMSFAVLKENRALLEDLKTGMAILKNTGEYSAIYVKWFGEEQKRSWILKYALWISTLISVVFLGASAWVWSLNRIVNRKTATLREELREKTIVEKEFAKSNEELEKKNNELDNFMYRASHDMISPLKTIRGLVHIMKIEEGFDSVGKHMDAIDAKARHLEDFIHNIVNYSITLQKDYKEESIVFEVLLDEIIKEVDNGIANNKIIFHKDFKAGLQLKSDARRLRMILSSLLISSCKYHDSEKADARILISTRQDKEKVTVKIEDNSVRSADMDLNNVFPAFYKAYFTKNNDNLGLHIAKDLVHRLNGKIYAEFHPDKGAVFTLHLPNTSTDERKCAGVSKISSL